MVTLFLCIDTLDDDDEVLWALAEQLGDNDFVVFVGGPEYSFTLLVNALQLLFAYALSPSSSSLPLVSSPDPRRLLWRGSGI